MEYVFRGQDYNHLFDVPVALAAAQCGFRHDSVDPGAQEAAFTALSEDAGARALAANWSRAAKELGVRVTAPFTARLPGGISVEAAALVHGFGCAGGMLLFLDAEPLQDLLGPLGKSDYGFATFQSAGTCGRWKPQDYLETLRDWRWTGSPSERPEWLEK